MARHGKCTEEMTERVDSALCHVVSMSSAAEAQHSQQVNCTVASQTQYRRRSAAAVTVISQR